MTDNRKAMAGWRYWGLKFSVGPLLVLISTFITRVLLQSIELMMLGWYLSISFSWMFNAWMRQRYQPRKGPGPGGKRRLLRCGQMGEAGRFNQLGVQPHPAHLKLLFPVPILSF